METIKSYNLNVPLSDVAQFERFVKEKGWELHVIDVGNKEKEDKKKRAFMKKLRSIAGSVPNINDAEGEDINPSLRHLNLSDNMRKGWSEIQHIE